MKCYVIGTVMKFEITFKSQFRALEFSLFVLLSLAGCAYYFKRTDPAFPIEYFVWVFLIGFIPVLFLHAEYMLLNRTSSLTITNDREFIYTDHLGNLRFYEEQIGSIFLFLPSSAYRGYIERQMQLLPFEPYGYAIIYTKDGDKIIITSLMVINLLDEFSKLTNVTIEKKKRLIASPSIEKVIQWFNRDGL